MIRSRYRRGMVIAATAILAIVVSPVLVRAAEIPALASVLAKPGDIAGFEPGNPQVFRKAAAVRDGAGKAPSGREIGRLEEEGFIEGAMVRMHGGIEPAAKGISSVFEFETPSGATSEMKAELKKELDPAAFRGHGFSRFLVLRHFTVSGVPKAVAFAVLSNKAAEEVGVETGGGKGLVVEGTCLFVVGIVRPASNEVIDPVIEGLRAVYRRVEDICP